MVFSDIIASVLGGGATGLLGAVVTRIADYKNRQLDIDLQKIKNDNELQMRHVDERIIEKELASRERVTFTEAEASMDIEASKSFQTALTNEPKLFHNPSKLTKAQNAYLAFVDGVRGLIRPGLTLYLCGVTTAVYMQAGTIIKSQPIPIEQSVEIYTQISSTILYLTTTCVLFWFGVRSEKRTKK